MKIHRWRIQAVPALVAVNTLIFLWQWTAGPEERGWILGHFALTANGLMEGRWWQLLTHAFLHGNLLHLMLNMVGLWFAGRIVERMMGSARFLILYLVSAIAGGLAQIIFTGGIAPLIGASGAVCGVLLAFATMFGNTEVMALLFFVIPLRLRAKYLGWAIILTSLVFLLIGIETWIGHAAHLGGAIAGYIFARLDGYGNPTFVERFFLHKKRP